MAIAQQLVAAHHSVPYSEGFDIIELTEVDAKPTHGSLLLAHDLANAGGASLLTTRFDAYDVSMPIDTNIKNPLRRLIAARFASKLKPDGLFGVATDTQFCLACLPAATATRHPINGPVQENVQGIDVVGVWLVLERHAGLPRRQALSLCLDPGASPIWVRDHCSAFVPPENLPIFADRMARINECTGTWTDLMARWPYPPDAGFSTNDEATAFRNKGMSVAETLQRELGHTWTVTHERIGINDLSGEDHRPRSKRDEPTPHDA